MVDKKPKNDCCGCRACEQICPVNAIDMVNDCKGFNYPKVDYSLCINCGLCEKICCFSKHSEAINVDCGHRVYAVKHKDEGVRLASTSGGMFTALSDYVLNNNGVVYGAIFNERLEVVHTRAVSKEQRDEMRGSKYVQSDIGDCFTRAKVDLDNGLDVLFTGTPCQIAALKLFLRKDYNNLLLVDFICHEVSSSKVWRDYLDYLENKMKDEIIGMEFRNKDHSWHLSNNVFHFKNIEKMSIRTDKSTFQQLFAKSYISMPSCYDCKFRGLNKCGDITIADFWGIESVHSDFDDDKGISLLLVNSKKGDSIIDHIKESLLIKRCTLDDCKRNLATKARKGFDIKIGWFLYRYVGIRAIIIYCKWQILSDRIKRKFVHLMKSGG